MNKVIRLLLVSVILILAFSPFIFVEASSYQSESTISFKKGNDYDDDSTHIPSGVVETTKPGESGVESIDKSGNTLPKTATNIYSLLVLGFVILMIGIAAFIYYLRKNKKEKIIE